MWGIDRYVYPRFTRVVNISGGPLDIHKADDLIADSSVRNEQIVGIEENKAEYEKNEADIKALDLSNMTLMKAMLYLNDLQERLKS